MGDTSVLEQLLDRIDSLYSLPAVAVQVLDLTHPEKKDVDYERLKNAIECDPALAAKVLRAANAPVFGGSGNVTTLPQAFRILGTQALRGIVISLSLPSEFANADPEILIAYWQSAICRSIAARECCRLLGESGSESVFVAGLLADIGMLALIQELGEQYVDFVKSARHHEEDLKDLETASLGFDHRTVSARLLERWGLPSATVSLIVTSNCLSTESEIRIEQLPAAILHAADIASSWLIGSGYSEDEVMTTCAAFFGWEFAQVTQWIQKLQAPIQAMSQLLDVRVDTRLDFQELLQEAADRLEISSLEIASDPPLNYESGEAAEIPTGDVPPREDAPPFARLESPNDASDSQSLNQDPVDSEGLSNEARFIGTTTSVKSDFDGLFGTKPDTIDEQPSGGFDQWEEDPGLLGRVSSSLQNCRLNRKAMSLLLVQIDDFESVMFSESVDGVYRIQQSIQVALERISRDDRGEVLEITDERFALLLPGLDRSEANRIGNTILQLIRQWSRGRHDKNLCPISLSLGCATVPIPAKNFDPRVLIRGAQKCLEGVQLGTGNGMKSIDVFY